MRVAKVAALISRFFTTSDRVLSGYEGRHSNGSRQNSTRLWPSPLLSAIISTNINSRSQLKQYDTEVVTKETVHSVLTNLGLGPESELLKMVANNPRESSVLASIFESLSSGSVTRDLGAQPRQEHSIPETMRIIEAKYDKILGEKSKVKV